jgi:hypothetical protein
MQWDKLEQWAFLEAFPIRLGLRASSFSGNAKQVVSAPFSSCMLLSETCLLQERRPRLSSSLRMWFSITPLTVLVSMLLTPLLGKHT